MGGGREKGVAGCRLHDANMRIALRVWELDRETTRPDRISVSWVEYGEEDGEKSRARNCEIRIGKRAWSLIAGIFRFRGSLQCAHVGWSVK